MADELITSTQPDTGNLLGEDIGGLDHYSSSPFSAETLQPQPSAPQPMSSPPNASKPLVDDFGFDSHITTTTASSNPPNPTSNSAAPNSSSSFTPGELTSNNPTTMSDDDDDDYKENHQHHQGEGNNYHPDDDDDDDGYDDREEELEEMNYQKNGAPYQDNPAFSDSDSPSEFHHHHSEAAREPSPYSAPPVHTGENNKIGGYDSDEHKYEDVEERKDVRLPEGEYEHSRHQDHDHNQANEYDDDEDVESLTEENAALDDDDEEEGDQFVYSASAAATTTTTTAASSATPAIETSEIIEAPSKSFETESSPQPSSLVSSEIPSPFSSSAAPMGADVAAEAEEASSAFDLAGDPSPALSTNYAPPSPSAPPAAATFSSSPCDDATSAVISQIMGDDDAASGFAGAVNGDTGRVSPAAAATEIMKTMDNYDDDHLQMPSAPPLSSTSLSSSPPLAPQPSAPPQPVEADHFSPQITSSTPQQASSTLYNSHSARENYISSEPESFTAEPNVVQTSPKITDQPKEVQPKPTLEGPWLKNIDPKEDAEPEVTLRDIPGLSTILDLIYWRDVKKTGVVFGSMLFILLSLAIFSVLSVIAYLSLAILSVTLSFRVYKNIMQAVQKSGEGHPFKDYLEWDIELNDQKTQKVVKLVMKHSNATVRELRRLFLVEDLVDSIKFGLLLWVLTYIGSWFNGMTLIINSVVIVFTLPKIYETYKVQIDNYLAMARSQFNKILQHPGVQSKLPFLKKKAKAQ